jgi:hypothetical protein
LRAAPSARLFASAFQPAVNGIHAAPSAPDRDRFAPGHPWALSVAHCASMFDAAPSMLVCPGPPHCPSCYHAPSTDALFPALPHRT